MKKIREEKGSMAVYVSVVLLSMLFILMAVFFTSNAIRKSQLETVLGIKETYESDNQRASEIYDSITGNNSGSGGGNSDVDTPTYVTNGLKLHYDAINNTGNGHSSTTMTWKDLSGNGNDGTLSSTPNNSIFYWDNNSMTIANHDEKLKYYIDTPLNLSGKERTYIYTVNANNLNGTIWGETDTENTYGLFNYHLFVANRGNSKTSDSRCTYTFSKDGIYCYAVSLSESQLKFYVNGQLESTASNTMGLICNNNLRLLSARYESQNASNIKMYNFMAYDRVLTDSEIQVNYNSISQIYNITT